MILEDKLKIGIVGLCLLTKFILPSSVCAENKEYNNLTQEHKKLMHNITMWGIFKNISWVDLDNNGKTESIVKEYKLSGKKILFYEKKEL